MISLGSNISATQVVESKYSANFDGTNDYIDTGQTFNSVFVGDYSISFWIKPNDGKSSHMIFGSDNTASNSGGGRFEIYFQLQGSGYPRLVMNALGTVGIWNTEGNGGFQYSDGAQNSWTHFVVTGDLQASGESIFKVYVNGIDRTNQQSEMTSSQHEQYANTYNLVIGATNVEDTIQGFYNGGIDEFAIFNTVLDSDAVTAIYNSGSPLNLKFNQGNYDNSSALQAYYRMGNGLFDDKANGIIHDQDSPGFGSEIITGNNATFDGANDWTAYNPSGTTGISTTGGVLQVTLSGAGNTVDSGAKLEVTSSLTAGKVYKVKADIWLGTETETSGWRIYLGGVDNAITLSSSQTTFVKYITITDTSDLLIYNTDVDSSTGTFFIDNVSVKELNGKPGVTSGGVTFSSDTP